MDINIESCPFCGKGGALNHNQKGGKDGSIVVCTNCESKGPWYPVNSTYSSDEKAVNAWNHRA